VREFSHQLEMNRRAFLVPIINPIRQLMNKIYTEVIVSPCKMPESAGSEKSSSHKLKILVVLGTK
jgi:hypothetical protein